MGELDLFPGGGAGDAGDGPGGPGAGSDPDRRPGGASGGEGGIPDRAPLAARMRPRTLEEFVGQEHLLGPGKALRGIFEGESPTSMIFWGPPGTGKTTLARLLARRSDAAFVGFSAVTEGVARVREIIEEAEMRLRASGRRTILFCDEIHRFNKAQQDAFLPHVEKGTVVLVGATTENPSFELNRPLLSRAPVFVLEPLEPGHLEAILRRALESGERGIRVPDLRVDDDAIALLARGADGDARRALGALEAAARLAGAGGRVDEEVAREALQHRFAIYDKAGEEHYNLISALHKSVRGSDPQGALYWLARMLEGGEDPLYIARRMVRMASEDIGLADPRALVATVAAREAYRFIGSPEGELALAEAAVYLATAPKSNRIYGGWKRAVRAARETPSAPVPLHVRNAPTELMEELGYGEGYEYEHHLPEGISAQTFLPDELGERTFYEPGEAGYEERIRDRMARWAELEERARRRGGDAGDPRRPDGAGEGAGDGDGEGGP